MEASVTVANQSDDEMRQKLFELLKKFAYEKKELTLASGQKTNVYLDCRQVYFRGEANFLLGELFFNKMIELEKNGINISACGGMAMGAIPLSCALSMAAFRRGRELPGFSVRKEAKDHGMMSKIEGDKALTVGSQVIVLEDVVTTAGSAISAIEIIRGFGLNVSNLLAIVDREQGGRERLLEKGVTMDAFFTLNDFS